MLLPKPPTLRRVRSIVTIKITANIKTVGIRAFTYHICKPIRYLCPTSSALLFSSLYISILPVPAASAAQTAAAKQEEPKKETQAAASAPVSTGETADASASRKTAPVAPTEADTSALTKPYAAASVREVEAGKSDGTGTSASAGNETRVTVIGTDPPGVGQTSQTAPASGRGTGVQSVSAPGQQ